MSGEMTDKLPTTRAERNRQLTEFFESGYNSGIGTAIACIDAEMNYQIEAGSIHIVKRLRLLMDLLESTRTGVMGAL